MQGTSRAFVGAADLNVRLSLPIKTSDYIGFAVMFAFGIWLLAFPSSYVAFTTWLLGKKYAASGTRGLMLSGATLIALWAYVLFTFVRTSK